MVSKWAATDVNTVAAEAGSPRKRWCGGGWDGGEGVDACSEESGAPQLQCGCNLAGVSPT